VSDPIVGFIAAVAVTLAVCHALGTGLHRWLRQPPVIGEMLGGLLLGPSLFGILWPAGRAFLFGPAVLAILTPVAQLGLVTFMFLTGLELRAARRDAEVSRRAGTDGSPDTAAGRRWRNGPGSLAIRVAGAMGLPFLAGVVLAVGFRSDLAGPYGGRLPYVLFLALALSITALPVLARILAESRIGGTRLGDAALACAGVGDGIAWAVLAVILVLAHGGGASAVRSAIGVAVLLLVSVLAIRPALARLVAWAGEGEDRDRYLVPVLLAGAYGYAAITKLTGLDAIIGGFLFGVLVPAGTGPIARFAGQMRGYVLVVLLPLFFAGVGLSTRVGAIGSWHGWLVLAVILAVAVAGKLGGAAGAALVTGTPPREALMFGTLMNCRGVTELAVATIGYAQGFVDATAFTMLVLVALVTTAATVPLLDVLDRRAGGPIAGVGIVPVTATAIAGVARAQMSTATDR